MNTKPGNAKVRIMIQAICILAIGLSGCAPREIVPAPIMLGGTCPEGMFEAGDGNCYANISCQDGYQLSNENPELVCVPESGDGPIVNPELGCSADQVFDDAGHCYSFDADGCIVGTAIVAGGWDCISGADTTTDTDTNEADTNTDDSGGGESGERKPHLLNAYMTDGDGYPIEEYGPNDTLYVFVEFSSASEDVEVRVDWYGGWLGTDFIETYTTTLFDTEILFSLSPGNEWDPGVYAADIYLDGENVEYVPVRVTGPGGCFFDCPAGGGGGGGTGGGGTGGGQTNFDGSYTGDACGITGTLILNGNVIQDPDSGSSTYITIDEFGYASDWSWNGTLGVEEYTNVQFGAGAVTGTVYINGWGTCDFIGYRD